MIPALVSSLHVLAIAAGLTSVALRDRAMSDALKGGPLGAIFRADNLAGLAAMLIIGSGLWRLLAGIEKPTDWYLREYFFHLKMTVLLLGMCCELPIMITLLRWRAIEKKGGSPDLRRLRFLRACNRTEGALFVAIIFIAPLMARGMWHKAPASQACAVTEAITARCLTCHGTTAPQGGLVMAGDPRKALVGVPSSTWPDQIRVVPGDAARSLLWRKVSGQQGVHGLSMPMGQPLDPALAADIAAWIAAGAPPCAP